MDLANLRSQITQRQQELSALQSQYRRLTGETYHGINSGIRYEHEFTYEENFTIRFNYIPECKGDRWTPDTPAEVEIVQILFFGEPLTVNQERGFIEEHEDDLTEMCWEEWSRHQDEEGGAWLNDIFDRLATERRRNSQICLERVRA